jgi:LPS export ABC transporter protein LptC
MRWKKLTLLRNKKILLISAGCLAAFSIAALIFSVVPEKAPRKTPLKIMDDQVDLQVMKVHYTEATEEGIKWEVNADSAQYRKKENLAVFKNPRIKMMMPDGRNFVLSGNEGFLHQDSKDMELSGDVLLVSNNGDAFKTDSLKYSGQEKRCYTTAQVSLKNSRLQIDARGMSISLKDEHLSLLSEVKAQLHK